MIKVNFFYTLIIAGITVFSAACGRESSPEGRMSIKVENLQKDMLEKLEEQNKAILDSLGQIRKEINALKNNAK